MRHRRAMGQLTALIDGTLPAALEGAVRRHAEGCATCQEELSLHQQCETLLRRLPSALVPRETARGVDAHARLVALARWAAPEPRGFAEVLGLRALSGFAAVCLLTLVMTVARWEPEYVGVQDAGPAFMIAQVPGATLSAYTLR